MPPKKAKTPTKKVVHQKLKGGFSDKWCQKMRNENYGTPCPTGCKEVTSGSKAKCVAQARNHKR